MNRPNNNMQQPNQYGGYGGGGFGYGGGGYGNIFII